MPLIELSIAINAPIERCFDLARSIDLHQLSTQHTNEQAIDGVTEGLINLGETVTWRAKHFGIYQQLTTLITAYDRPHRFVDEMVKGAFQSFCHVHTFQNFEGKTVMRDEFHYVSPFGIIGKFVDIIVLKDYMKKLLILRNETIKEVAESDQWQNILP